MLTLTIDKLHEIINSGESLEVEFKSDRNKLSDSDIYEEIVAMANTNGGILLIGIEDDGKITGAKARHGKITESLKVRSAVFNNTVPNIDTQVSILNHPKGQILAIEVLPCSEPCATASGKSLRRNIGSDGKPHV